MGLKIIEKENPVRDKEYTGWVKSLDCCNCGAPGDDPHHVINEGEGGTGTKACDLFTMSLCRICHNIIHNANHPHSAAMKAMQWKWVCKTLRRAVKQGVISSIPQLSRNFR